jgi:hypothetical protein
LDLQCNGDGGAGAPLKRISKTSLKFRKTLKKVAENKTEVGKLNFYSPKIVNQKILG